MSRLFGPLRQMGYVVPDVEAAMRHWVEVCGVGPWFYAERLPLTSFSYGGARYDDIHLSIGLANSGEMQIELIQQRSEHPSMAREFLLAHPKGGLQHWSSWPENYDELYQRALANGYQVGQEGDAPRGRCDADRPAHLPKSPVARKRSGRAQYDHERESEQKQPELHHVRPLTQ